MNDRDKEIKSNSDTYEIYLGTFIDDAFTWYSIKKFKDPTQAYKEFKKYVNTQLKYTDEELQQVWDTGRLDIELRQGNKLLNWVGIYSREVKDLSKEEEKEAEKGEVKKKNKKDSVKDSAAEKYLEDFSGKILNGKLEYKFDSVDDDVVIYKITNTSTGKKILMRLNFQEYPLSMVPSYFSNDPWEVPDAILDDIDPTYAEITYEDNQENEIYDEILGILNITSTEFDDMNREMAEHAANSYGQYVSEHIDDYFSNPYYDSKPKIKDSGRELIDYKSGTKFIASYPLYELLEDNKEFEAFVFESMYNFCKGNDEEVIYHYEPDELSSIYISKKPDDEYGWIDFSY